MRLDKKGDLGFPEAILAVMIVTLVLMIYLGAFVIQTGTEDDESPELDDEILSGISIRDNEFTANIDDGLYKFLERNDYKGIKIECWTPGNLIESHYSHLLGNMDGKLQEEHYLKTISSDDGRMIPVIFEVTLCI